MSEAQNRPRQGEFSQSPGLGGLPDSNRVTGLEPGIGVVGAIVEVGKIFSEDDFGKQQPWTVMGNLVKVLRKQSKNKDGWQLAMEDEVLVEWVDLVSRRSLVRESQRVGGLFLEEQAVHALCLIGMGAIERPVVAERVVQRLSEYFVAYQGQIGDGIDWAMEGAAKIALATHDSRLVERVVDNLANVTRGIGVFHQLKAIDQIRGIGYANRDPRVDMAILWEFRRMLDAFHLRISQENMLVNMWGVVFKQLVSKDQVGDYLAGKGRLDLGGVSEGVLLSVVDVCGYCMENAVSEDIWLQARGWLRAISKNQQILPQVRQEAEYFLERRGEE